MRQTTWPCSEPCSDSQVSSYNIPMCATPSVCIQKSLRTQTYVLVLFFSPYQSVQSKGSLRCEVLQRLTAESSTINAGHQHALSTSNALDDTLTKSNEDLPWSQLQLLPALRILFFDLQANNRSKYGKTRQHIQSLICYIYIYMYM